MATTNHGKTTADFFAKLDRATRTEILSAIAKHYVITNAEALDEITDPEAEHLLDYLTGSKRAAVSVLMQKHGFR